MAGDHKCPVCQATFTRPQHVARHMRSHTGDRPYKCQHCGDQFARSDLLSRHINKCHAAEKPPTTNAPNQRRKGATAACRATTSKQACDQCVTGTLPCDGANPCTKCVQRKTRCTYVKFHRQTAPSGPGHQPPPRAASDELLDPMAYTVLPNGRYAQSELIYPGTDAAALALANANALYAGPGAGYNPYAQNAGYAGTAAGLPSQEPPMDALELAARYRQQAELLRRQGLLPPAQIVQPEEQNHHNQYLPGTGNGTFAYDYNQPRYAQSQPAWMPENKHINALDQLSYANANQYPRASAPGYNLHPNYGMPEQQTGHHRTQSYPDNTTYRRGSLSGSETSGTGTNSSEAPTTSSSAQSSIYNLPIEVGAASHPRGGYAPITETRPTTASSVNSSTSPDNRPGTTMALPHDGHAHDGFSSAFGLMSLDDPSVLAGLASDGQPFFSSLAATTPTPARERERAGAGGILSGRSAESDREAETRDLRDFWKQYMKTPLSIGTGASGGPSFAENGGILGGGTATNGAAAARPGMGKRGLSRVASLPSVKTPALEFASANAAYALNPVQQQQQGMQHVPQQAQDDSYLGAQQRTYHAADDLRRYEAAVLSRKAPVQLNLIPRRARTNSTIDEGYGTQTSSSVSPPSGINTVLEESALRGMSSSVSPPNHPAVIPQQQRTKNTTMAPPPDPTTAGLAGSFDAERPSFKRNASQTLGPENAKRTMRESDVEYALDDSADDAAYAFYARGGSESPVPPEERRAYAPLPERYRRMSAPQAPPMGLVGHHMQVQPPEAVPYA